MDRFRDEHSVTIAAGADEVWSALVETLEASLSGAGAETYARLVGCADASSSGPRPLAEGSAIPGFRVASAIQGSELALQGRHRFSTYELLFRIESAEPGRARLSAESRAEFPGVLGAAYRLFVIGSGGHALLVRRMLGIIRTRAESRPAPPTEP